MIGIFVVIFPWHMSSLDVFHHYGSTIFKHHTILPGLRRNDRRDRESLIKVG